MVRFGGRRYKLDLTEANAEQVEGALAGWAACGRDVVIEESPEGPVRTVARRLRSAEVRAWARYQGWDLAARGRLPDDAVEAFRNE